MSYQHPNIQDQFSSFVRYFRHVYPELVYLSEWEVNREREWKKGPGTIRGRRRQAHLRRLYGKYLKAAGRTGV